MDQSLWSAPWFRGLVFGAAVGVVVGVFDWASKSPPGGAGSGRSRAATMTGVKTLGPGDHGAVPELSPREEALIRVAQEYANKQMWAEADKVASGLPAGPARDQALDRIIQVQVEVRFPDFARGGRPAADVVSALRPLVTQTERMGPSVTKVERLIKLAEVQIQMGAAPGGPPAAAGTGGRVDPFAASLLARAAAVAASIPPPSAPAEAPTWWHTPLLVAAFGLIGMATAWVATSGAGHRPRRPEPDALNP